MKMNGFLVKLLSVVGAASMIVLIVLGVQQSRHLGASGATAAAPPAAADAPAAASDSADGSVPHIAFFKAPQPIPDFSVTTFDGQTITPASMRGKVVIVNFWATWCGPCRAEIPSFIALQKKYPDQLLILGLSDDETGDAGVRKFVADNKMTYPVAMATRQIDEAFGGIPALPTSFMVDPQGRVVQKHVGLNDPSMYELEVRSLAHLPVNAVVDTVDNVGPGDFDKAADENKIPGIDLSSLTPTQKAEAIKRMKTERCTCGCEMTVGQCRVNDPTCETSLGLAKAIVAAVKKDVK